MLNDEHEIVFSSDFECGNGQNFKRIGENEYEFEIRPDSNSSDRQWFYFAVNNAAGRTLTFHITETNHTNIPHFWSRARPVSSWDGGKTWAHVTGHREYKISENRFIFNHSILTDHVLIAFHFPYSYSYFISRLAEWRKHPSVSISHLGNTKGNNKIECLKIEEGETPRNERVGIWITARVHAGETTSSWMLDGLIDYLLHDTQSVRKLREKTVFNIVPMVNPDGVIQGNYRNNKAGVNLNRVWDDLEHTDSPSVKAVVDAIHKWTDEGNPYDIFLDLHSDSEATTNYAFHAAEGVEPPLAENPTNYHFRLRDFLVRLSEVNHDFSYDYHEGPEHNTSDLRFSRTHQMMTHGVLSLLFEGTYSRVEQSKNPDDYMTPERHRRLGASLGHVLLETILLKDVSKKLH
jgi:murein tripeptide amidase MpaA